MKGKEKRKGRENVEKGRETGRGRQEKRNEKREKTVRREENGKEDRYTKKISNRREKEREKGREEKEREKGNREGKWDRVVYATTRTPAGYAVTWKFVCGYLLLSAGTTEAHTLPCKHTNMQLSMDKMLLPKMITIVS